MADDKIIKKDEDVIKSAQNRLVKRSLSQLVKGSKDVLLCDVSYSMDDRVDYENKKIDVLRNVLQSFEGCTLYEFSSTTKRVFGTLSDPNGGTNLTDALNHLKEKNIKEFVLLTDGQPDNQGTALEAAHGLKINIVYIGPKPTPVFLQQLAKATGGTFEDVDIVAAGKVAGKAQLTSKIKGLLGSGS